MFFSRTALSCLIIIVLVKSYNVHASIGSVYWYCVLESIVIVLIIVEHVSIIELCMTKIVYHTEGLRLNDNLYGGI